MPALEFSEDEKAILFDLAEGTEPALVINISREHGEFSLNSLLSSGYVTIAGDRVFLTDKGNRALEGNLQSLTEGFV